MENAVTLGDGAVFVALSGQSVTLQDIIWASEGPDGPVARFRFVAPAIAREGGNISADTASADLQHLCQTFALAKLAERGAMPDTVVVSMADRPVVFGQAAPEATQYFDLYRIDGDTCVWELF